MGKKTIKLKKYGDIVNEEVAAETITPGALVELNSSGNVQNHSTADGAAATMIALEDELQGNTIEDDYSADDPVQVWYVQPGEEALILVGSGYDPAVGDYLQSNGDGTFQAHGSGEAIFQVVETKQIDDSSNHRVLARRV